MPKHISNWIRAVVFLFFLIISLNGINQVTMPKYILTNSLWPTTSTFNQFYEMDENSIEVLFLGSSFAVNAFSPQEIYNDYGIRSYNLGSEQQSIFLSYYWLKEALRFQTPQVVVLDTRFLFEINSANKINTGEGLIRKCLDPMKWSEIKREAISALCDVDESQNELSYYLTNIRFHTRWTNLKEYDFITEETRYSPLKGYSPIAAYGPDSYAVFTSSGNTETKQEPQEMMQIYLDKIADLCKSEGIQLVLVTLPDNPMNDSINNTLTAYSKDNDIDYYNMCEASLYNSIGAKLPKESMLNHENLWGAMKMSQYVGGMLRDIYHVKAVKDEQYESTREFYNNIIRNCELVHITDINEYLKAINYDNYTVFISARDDAVRGLTDETGNAMNALGLSNLTGKSRLSYVAVISSENGVQEKMSENSSISLSGSIRNGRSVYSVNSSGYLAGTSSSIIIDGTEYCINKRGLNFVIYDNDLMKVIDKVTFDTCGESDAAR